MRRRHVLGGDQPGLRLHRLAQRRARRAPSASAASWASIRRSYSSRLGNLASIGSQTGAPPALPGRRTARPAIASLPGTGDVAGVLIRRHVVFDQPRQHLAQVPRDFTLVSLREIAHAAASICIRPGLVRLQPLGDQLERFAQPLFQCGVQLSSTVRRISSSRAPLSACSSCSRWSTVARTSDRRRSLIWISPCSCSPKPAANRASDSADSARAAWASRPRPARAARPGPAQLRAQGAGRLRQFAAQAAGPRRCRRAARARCVPALPAARQAGGSGGRAQASREAKQAS